MKRLLIANRGEIACRIIRTCRTLGIETVAVTSEVEAGALWMQMADFGVVLGPGNPKDSYLNSEKIIKYAHHYQVDAIHPGYGFFSENSDFAERVRKEGFVFVGPSSQAIEAMGSKSTAKTIAAQAGVPIIPGYTGAEQSTEKQSLEILQTEASRVGYPLLIKATYGGGGKGMRLVHTEAEFAPALASCQREAENAFGCGAVMLEKYILNPRHIEVQVFADQQGAIVTLSERDCSLQRRHQKVIEEAPAADLPADIYEKLRADSVKIAQAVKYEGAGTIEFLVDGAGQYYFLEMNTRLQVEHPVTEEILGLDLVALQLQIAQGEPLPFSQNDLDVQGHALEVRLYAEDPEQEFLPSTGRLIQFKLPHSSDTVRVETGYEKGDLVTPYYDPLLAKIIVWGETRRAAYGHLKQALSFVRIDGVKTNLLFLKQLVVSSCVTDSYPDIGYIDLLMTTLKKESIPPLIYALGCAWLYTYQLNNKLVKKPFQNPSETSPWHIRDGWRVGEEKTTLYLFCDEDEPITAHVYSCETGELNIKVKNETICLDFVKATATSVWALNQGYSVKGAINYTGNRLAIDFEKHLYSLRLTPLDQNIYEDHKASAHLNSPMPGRVISVLVKKGDKVEKGDALLILEAMKMEHTIRAPYSGVVETVLYAPGDFVEEGVELAHLSAQLKAN